MRKLTLAASSMGSAALLLTSTAFGQIAVPDLNISFGQFADEAGCTAAGFTCTTLATGNGFSQIQIDDPANPGISYIQTVINDAANGFTSEDFVQVNFGGTGSTPGIASKLSIVEGTPTAPGTTPIANGFSTNATITSGWATGPGGPSAKALIDLTVSEAGTANDDFTAFFQVDTDFDAATGTNTLNSLTAQQEAFLGAATDKQVFYTQIKPAAAAMTNYTIPGGQGTANWNAGDMIQVVWIGQDMPSAQIVGAFGAQSVSNVNDPANPVGTTFSSTTQVGPWDWQTGEFGTAPTF